MLKEIESRFGAAKYMTDSTPGMVKMPNNSSSPSPQKGIPLSIVKRTKPVPPVGYYDDI